MVVQYLFNRRNKMLYKAVNNKVILMWFRSRGDWGVCATTYQDLFCGDYIENFDAISERQADELK